MRLGKDVIATDLYRVLGVPQGATVDQVRRAYRHQVMTSHPDLHGADAERRMVELNVAACILLDAQRRAEYDRQRSRLRSAPPTPAGDDWYPWGTPAAPSSPEWVRTVPRRAAPLDQDCQADVERFRGGPERSIQRLLGWSDSWAPGTHLAITFTSVCLALLLIAAARPTSLPGYQGKKPIACAEDGSF